MAEERFSEFKIENDLESLLELAVEPEGAIITLRHGEEVVVKDKYLEIPATVRLSRDAAGSLVVCVWPGDGDTRVERDGKNVLL